MTNMTPALVRAGRAILKMSIGELAECCGISRTTLSDFENGKAARRPRGMNKAGRIALARFFQEAGIEFIGADTPGLIVRKPELLD